MPRCSFGMMFLGALFTFNCSEDKPGGAGGSATGTGGASGTGGAGGTDTGTAGTVTSGGGRGSIYCFAP